MKTTERLIESAREIWNEYYDHPFVRGIKDGTLDREKFKYYIIQDYLYLIDYVRVFAIGAAKAPDVPAMKLFVDYCKTILDTEMNIHDGYMGKLGITEEDLDMQMAIDNAAYTSYMLRVAYEEDAAAIAVTILACAYSYEVISRRMVSESPESLDDPMYGEWIKGYSCEEYHQENLTLMEFTDRLTEGISEEEYKHLERIFVDCSRFEKMFWDMGWEMRS